jgi:hypothetical protein
MKISKTMAMILNVPSKSTKQQQIVSDSRLPVQACTGVNVHMCISDSRLLIGMLV